MRGIQDANINSLFSDIEGRFWQGRTTVFHIYSLLLAVRIVIFDRSE